MLEIYMNKDTLSAHIESVLFATEKPLPRKKLAMLLDASSKEIDDALIHLRDTLDGRGITLVETDNEIMLRTALSSSHYIAKMRNDELSQDLGRAGVETLAIILYRGGAYRSEIDWIRGVRSSATIRSLLVRGLIKGVADARDKRRIYYRPTVDALAHLGITQLKELPRYDELTRVLCDVTKITEDTLLS